MSAASVRALARVESGRTLRHPAFLAGLAIAAFGTANYVRQTLVSSTSTWDDDSWTAAVGFLVLAILTMIATNLAALRDRRSGTAEQHASLPAGTGTRTAGLLVSVAGPAAVGVVLFGGVMAYGITRESFALVDYLHLAELGALFALLGVLGVAIAAWLPSAIVAPVVAWGLFLISPTDDPAAWQIAWPLSFVERASLSAWHLLETVGLVLVVSAIALRRGTRRPAVVVLGIVGLAVVVASVAVMIPRACIAPHVCSF